MVKITGLIRVFNQVRTRLQIGLAPEEVASFQELVQSSISQVEEICTRHGRPPGELLPGPSRMAYQFLKDLDLNDLPLRASHKPDLAVGSLRVRNVVGFAEDTAQQLWQKRQHLLDSPVAREELVEQLRHHCSEVERICLKHGQSVTGLEPRTRSAYAYLRYVSEITNLQDILAAIATADRVRQGFRLPSNSHLEIHLLAISSLWRFRQHGRALIFKVNIGFIKADEEVWQALIGSVLSPAQFTRGRQVVSAFGLTEEFSNVLFEVEAMAAPPAPITRGRVHDLEESFERVNRTYFGGCLERPVLSWNQTLTSNKFGHYQPARDTVMVSVSLDSQEVPESLLDFVMYHELLHKKHGSTTVNGRRVVHGPAFRAEERLFADWEKTEKLLNQLARRQANRR